MLLNKIERIHVTEKGELEEDFGGALKILDTIAEYQEDGSTELYTIGLRIQKSWLYLGKFIWVNDVRFECGGADLRDDGMVVYYAKGKKQ